MKNCWWLTVSISDLLSEDVRKTLISELQWVAVHFKFVCRLYMKKNTASSSGRNMISLFWWSWYLVPHCKQKGTQVLCTTNTAGYVMTQGPGGVPVAVPIQATCAQGGQAPMVMVPGPGAAGGQQPLVVHAGPTGAIPGTGHTPQETEIPSYGHGQYLPLNEPVSDWQAHVWCVSVVR